MFPPQAGREAFPAFRFWWPPPHGSFSEDPASAFLQPSVLCASVSIQGLFSFDLGPTYVNQDDLISVSLIPSPETFFLSRVPSTGSRN